MDSTNASQSLSVKTTPDYTVGSIRLRMSAWFFDSMVVGIPVTYISAVLLFIFDDVSPLGNPSLNIFMLVFFAIFMISYFVYFDIKSGSTIGKQIYGLKIIEAKTGVSLSAKQAIMREIIARASSFIPFIGALFSAVNFFVTLSSKERLAIHDRVVKSRVIKYSNSWSFLKQLGFFLLLLLIAALPYAYIYQKTYRAAEENKQCILSCIQNKNVSPESDSTELQKYFKECSLQCQK